MMLGPTSQRLYLTHGWKLTSSRRRGLMNDKVRSVRNVQCVYVCIVYVAYNVRVYSHTLYNASSSGGARVDDKELLYTHCTVSEYRVSAHLAFLIICC